MAFAGPIAQLPTGWLVCDGSPQSASALPTLYSVISTVWGGVPENGGDFFLPDLRGMFLRGVDGGSGNDPNAAKRLQQGSTTSNDTGVGSWQQCDVQNHVHWSNQFVGGDSPGDNFNIATSGQGDQTGNLNPSDGGNPGNESRPVNGAVYFIIYTGL